MLADSGFIQEHDTYTFNKRRVKKGLKPVDPIYTQKDAVACMSLFIGVPNNMKFRIDDNIKVTFTPSGHMLGSGVATLQIIENGQIKRISYTGDIGRPENKILSPPEPFPQSDILITESTYGDRLHLRHDEAENELLNIVVDTCVTKGGKLIIPAFSVGRTQEIVYSLNRFSAAGKLPKIDIFVDSPLAVNATSVFRLHPECFNKEIHEFMLTDPDPFGFNSLFYITRQQDSKKLNDHKKPCVIISASGMAEAGRIKHHIANNVEDHKNTILMVGYCSPSTLGARLLNGAREVSIHGEIHQVIAEIKKIDSFSGHGDYNEMLKYLECQDAGGVEQTFIVHGEYETQKIYAQKVAAAGFRNVEIPAQGQSFDLKI
jgi:metallo-beta-lactamase family protein